LVCQPGSVALGESILRLLNDEDARVRMARAAKASAQASDWASIAECVELVYREAILTSHALEGSAHPSCT
ncbi:MAG TPA: hypothetical protein VK821_04690, partial [Dehalococcoidia bacterium]|nr:hypothetical protein [Dehalococcoidia bacterium]